MYNKILYFALHVFICHDHRILLLERGKKELDKGGNCDVEPDNPGRLANGANGYGGEDDGYGNEEAVGFGREDKDAGRWFPAEWLGDGESSGGSVTSWSYFPFFQMGSVGEDEGASESEAFLFPLCGEGRSSSESPVKSITSDCWENDASV